MGHRGREVYDFARHRCCYIRGLVSKEEYYRWRVTISSVHIRSAHRAEQVGNRRTGVRSMSIAAAEVKTLYPATTARTPRNIALSSS
jgi:hypothetical protein